MPIVAGKMNLTGETKTGAHKPWSWWLVSIILFCLAFSLRAIYDCIFLEHRIAHFGDAYNFLRSGSCVYEAVATSHNLSEFFSKIYSASAPHEQLLQSMTSMKLTDRLLIDGPVYPAYLAIVEWISGIDPLKPIFDSHSVQIILCNSFVDSLVCVFVYFIGRLAFNRKTALIAAATFAIYPAAIINTQHCYSEPFAYFLLTIWTTMVLALQLRHRKNRRIRACIWIGIGAFAGLLTLSKPAFIILPPIIAAELMALSIIGKIVHFRSPAERKTSILVALRKFVLRGALIALGALVVLTPWILFNKAATGQYSVFVNRVPSFNIFHGNQLKTDGWRCYPYFGTFPGGTPQVIASLLEDAKKSPLPFLGLQFKKIARLWSGVWNEYHYPLFGVPLAIQSIFHQLLILLGVIGLSLALAIRQGKTFSRSFSAAVVLGTIAIFHFVYIPFEAISRYAITAMPSLIILAAFVINRASGQIESRRALAGLLGFAVWAFFLISVSGNTASFIASWLPEQLVPLSPYLSTLLIAIMLIGVIAQLKWLCETIVDRTALRNTLILPTLFSGLAFLVAAFYTCQSFDWQEWSSKLKVGDSIVQTIKLPAAINRAGTAFVLIDLDANILTPPLDVYLNGTKLSERPEPLAQLQADNKDILQCLAIQGEGMARDLRTFRNWWVIPCSGELLRPDAENRIEIKTEASDAAITIYGDYLRPDKTDGSLFLPSLRSFSYTKGFTTFDHRDPRVFEKQQLLGQTTTSERKTRERADAEDLSEHLGRQSGQFRIRILIPKSLNNTSAVSNKTAFTSFNEPLQILGSKNEHTVVAQNPATFAPVISVVNLPENLPKGIRFFFTCKFQSISAKHPCFVNVSFEGTDADGKARSWNSQWQPIGINIHKNKVIESSFGDEIPNDVLRWKNLQAKIMFSPFQPDLLFLKRKEALKTLVKVSDASLYFLPPLEIPDLENRDWSLY